MKIILALLACTLTLHPLPSTEDAPKAPNISALRDGPTDVEEMPLLGMTLREIDDEARKAYGFDKFDGCYIAKAGTLWKDLGISALADGCQISMVSDVEGRKNTTALFPPHVAANILDALSVDPKDPKIQTCRLVVAHPHPKNPKDQFKEEYPRLSAEHVASLRHLLRPVTFFGVTFTHASAALREKNGMGLNESIVVTAVEEAKAQAAGLGALKPGHSVTMISVPGRGQGVMSPVHLVQCLLKYMEPVEKEAGIHACSLGVWIHKPGVPQPEVISCDLKLNAPMVQELLALLGK